MKPMKVMRRKRKNDNLKRIIIFTVIALIVVVLIVSGVLIYRAFDANAPFPFTKTEEVEKAKYCAINDGENVEMKVEVGDLCMLTTPEDVSSDSLEFVSSNEDILRVDSGGRVDALKEGEAIITITGDSFEGYCNFAVSESGNKSDNEKFVSSAITANSEYVKNNSENDDRPLYMLQVNRKTNVVTVYTYDDKGNYKVPVRAMVCSCGKGGDEATPTGDFRIQYKARWNALEGDCYGQYISGFNGDILFHSVPYFTQSADDLEVDEFNKLGENASQGCVRLTVSDTKWVYDNCPLNTEVKVVDQKENVDSLGKPLTMKISGDLKWDPTDPDEDNPYLEKSIDLSGVEDKTIKVGDEFDSLKDVSAKDMCGNDITERIKATGNVINTKKGTYYLTYDVSDNLNNRLSKTVKIIVE